MLHFLKPPSHSNELMSSEVVKEKIVAFEKGGSNFDLKVNDYKTGYMVVSTSDWQYVLNN